LEKWKLEAPNFPFLNKIEENEKNEKLGKNGKIREKLKISGKWKI
jgi:hypothetical protein